MNKKHKETLIYDKDIEEPKTLDELFKEFEGDYVWDIIIKDDIGEEFW